MGKGLSTVYMAIDKEELGRRLAAARTETGRTQREVGFAVGLNKNIVSRLETARVHFRTRASFEDAVKVAQFLAVEIPYVGAEAVKKGNAVEVPTPKKEEAQHDLECTVLHTCVRAIEKLRDGSQRMRVLTYLNDRFTAPNAILEPVR